MKAESMLEPLTREEIACLSGNIFPDSPTYDVIGANITEATYTYHKNLQLLREPSNQITHDKDISFDPYLTLSIDFYIVNTDYIHVFGKQKIDKPYPPQVSKVFTLSQAEIDEFYANFQFYANWKNADNLFNEFKIKRTCIIDRLRGLEKNSKVEFLYATHIFKNIHAKEKYIDEFRYILIPHLTYGIFPNCSELDFLLLEVGKDYDFKNWYIDKLPKNLKPTTI
jgi:hypothetical protein